MKNKKSKKIMIVGAMAALLTLIGVTGSETYAKYVESTTVKSQTATVARWGFVQTVDANDLFGKTYKGTGLATIDETPGATGIVVNSVASAGDIVAPGTTGSMKITIGGMAEVDYKLDFGTSIIYDIKLSDGTNTYYPLQWNLSANIGGTALNQTGTLDQCLTALSDTDYTFNAGTDLAVEVNLSWVWEFEAADQSCAVTYNGNPISKNVADTFLGILASESVAENGFGYSYADIVADFGAKSSLKVGFTDFAIQLEQIQEA